MRVKGRGNPKAKTLLLGEKPGRDELKLGKVFVGPTGVELDKILWKAGISQDDVWIDNLIEDAPTGDDWTVTDDDIKRNQAHIDDFIFGQFENVVTMGAVSTRYMLGDGVKSDIYTVHAIPHLSNWCHVFPTVHPAAGFHDVDAYPYIISDFRFLSLWMEGKWGGPDRRNEYPNPHYSPLTDRDVNFIRKYFKDHDEVEYIFVDTEGSVKAPWCLSWCTVLGEAFVIQTKDGEAIKALAKEVRDRKITVVMHYAVHDIPVLRLMGWDLIGENIMILDMMVAAYLLQIEPQGLKNLAYRHCSIEMNNYLDLVSPYSLDKRLDWLLTVNETDWGKPEPILTEKKNETKITQPQGLNRRIDGILKDLEANPDEVDLYKRWNDIHPIVRGLAESTYGELPVANLDDVPFEEAFRYAAEDANGTGQVFYKLTERLAAMELYDTFIMDCACIPMIEEMQTTGFKVDPSHFIRLVTEWRGEQGKIRKRLADEFLCGRYINPESPAQVSKVLFKEWGLPVYKETKGGDPSTSDKAIDWLKDRHPGVGLIGRHREYDKGITSFAEPILGFIGDDPDNRLHTNIKYTRVVSGRFSASEPNLLAMPVRSDLGKEIRNGFVAGDGNLLGSWDLSQIEMRFMAHESGDRALIETFARNGDVHNDTAAAMFGKRIEDVTPEDRDPAKRTGFGVITGITEVGLKDQFYLNGITKYDTDDCKYFIKAWFDVHKDVKTYLERCKAEARRYGYVRESIGGRIRYLQAVQSTNKRIMAEAERASHSHKISSGAQAVLKKAMTAIWPRIDEIRRADNVFIKWILQVHDELIFEFPEGYEGVMDSIVVDRLCNTTKLRVPIKAAGKWSKTWGKLK